MWFDTPQAGHLITILEVCLRKGPAENHKEHPEMQVVVRQCLRNSD